LKRLVDRLTALLALLHLRRRGFPRSRRKGTLRVHLAVRRRALVRLALAALTALLAGLVHLVLLVHIALATLLADVGLAALTLLVLHARGLLLCFAMFRRHPNADRHRQRPCQDRRAADPTVSRYVVAWPEADACAAALAHRVARR